MESTGNSFHFSLSFVRSAALSRNAKGTQRFFRPCGFPSYFPSGLTQTSLLIAEAVSADLLVQSRRQRLRRKI